MLPAGETRTEAAYTLAHYENRHLIQMDRPNQLANEENSTASQRHPDTKKIRTKLAFVVFARHLPWILLIRFAQILNFHGTQCTAWLML